MADLLSLLALGSAGIAAQNAGVAVATNNVANASTPGYARQRVQLSAAPGGGVRSGAPARVADALLAGRMRAAGGTLARSRASAEALGDLEQRLTAGTTIDQRLGALFAAVGAASASPTDDAARTAVVTAARDLAAGTRQRAADLDGARAEVNARLGEQAGQATALARRLADANLQIARGGDPALGDERERLAGQLAELTGGRARIDPDGQLRFVLDGGAVLVDGERAAALEAQIAPATGDVALAVVDGAHRRDVTGQLGGGALAAGIAFRDGPLAASAAALDQLAYDTATALNAAHAASAGKDGVTGRLLFGAPAQVAGAARALALDPAVDADPGKLALAAPGAGPGDNAGALALLALATQPAAAGGRSLTDAALDLVARVATAAATSHTEVARDELVSGHLTALRDSVSGVDIDEELTSLARFQHASSAMTKVVSAIDDLLGELIDRL